MKRNNLKKRRYTKTRRPYKDYLHAEWKWSCVLLEAKHLKSIYPKRFLNILSKKYGICRSTLGNKFNAYEHNKINMNTIDLENRGGSNQYFSYLEEKIIFNTIKHDYIDQKKYLCNDIIRNIAIKIHKEKKVSSGWVTRFKKRWNLSTVKNSHSRKATKQYTDDENNAFLQECQIKRDEVGDAFFLNTDETYCRNINVSSKTIHIKGTGSAKTFVNGNDKEGSTMTLINSASGIMLKPILTAKGKTNRCLKKYELPEDIIGTYSNNGWTNNGVFQIVLDNIFEYTKGEKCVLLLDQFPCHKSDFTREEALARNIELLFIPIGLTYKHQPLDVSINGILKQKIKSSWIKEIVEDSNKKITYKDAIKHFLSALKTITSYTIINSFDKAIFNYLD